MKLRKELGPLDVFCIACGAMLSGLFVLPGLGYEIAGPAVLLGYGIAGLLALTGLLSQAELSSAMPKAGGTYFYVTRSMGSGVGTVYGLITWLSMALKSSYELLFMAAIARGLLEMLGVGLAAPIIALVLTAAFVMLNLVGVKEAGKLQVYMVLVLLGALALFCVLAMTRQHVDHFGPFVPHGVESVALAAGFVFVSFGGLLKVASVAEEVKDPGKTLPAAMVAAMIVIAIVYVLVVFLLVGVLGADLAGTQTPVADASAILMGRVGRVVFSVAAMLAIVSSVNAGIMAASRYPLGLARDRMLPPAFGCINQRFSTPHWSVLITGVVVAAALFLNVRLLVKAASTVLILTYMFTCIAVVILRESRVQNYQPQFLSPLYPWVQVLGAVGFVALLYLMGLKSVLTACGLVVAGMVVYWAYGRKQSSQEHALLHLVERITAKELTSRELEIELKEIIHERDEILKDRFDHLVEACPVLDLPGPVTAEEFFKAASEPLAGPLEMTAEAVFDALLQREEESSTVLTPFLAVPHIVVPGEKHFDILLARSKEGIVFSEEAPHVHTVFVLMGTKDERPFHLMTLAAIAQIVQEDDFEQRWMDAKDAEALRDVVLLGKRRRHN